MSGEKIGEIVTTTVGDLINTYNIVGEYRTGSPHNSLELTKLYLSFH